MSVAMGGTVEALSSIHSTRRKMSETLLMLQKEQETVKKRY